jgi:predicted LPLAT superfamily acyltransferase
MNAPAKAPWLQKRERGSRSAMQFMKWLALRCGRRIARLVLVPICTYFLLFSPRARSASREYLACALGRPARLADVWRHYFTFAATVLDRIYFIDGRFGRFDIEVSWFRRTLPKGEGAFCSARIWAASSCCARSHPSTDCPSTW